MIASVIAATTSSTVYTPELSLEMWERIIDLPCVACFALLYEDLFAGRSDVADCTASAFAVACTGSTNIAAALSVFSACSGQNIDTSSTVCTTNEIDLINYDLKSFVSLYIAAKNARSDLAAGVLVATDSNLEILFNQPGVGFVNNITYSFMAYFFQAYRFALSVTHKAKVPQCHMDQQLLVCTVHTKRIYPRSLLLDETHSPHTTTVKRHNILLYIILNEERPVHTKFGASIIRS